MSLKELLKTDKLIIITLLGIYFFTLGKGTTLAKKYNVCPCALSHNS